MMEMVAQKLRQMGGTVELVDVGEQEVSARANAASSRRSLTLRLCDARSLHTLVSDRLLFQTEVSIADALITSKRLQNNSAPHLDPHYRLRRIKTWTH